MQEGERSDSQEVVEGGGRHRGAALLGRWTHRLPFPGSEVGGVWLWVSRAVRVLPRWARGWGSHRSNSWGRGAWCTEERAAGLAVCGCLPWIPERGWRMPLP